MKDVVSEDEVLIRTEEEETMSLSILSPFLKIRKNTRRKRGEKGKTRQFFFCPNAEFRFRKRVIPVCVWVGRVHVWVGGVRVIRSCNYVILLGL